MTIQQIIDEINGLDLSSLPYNRIYSLLIETGIVGMMEETLFANRIVHRARLNDIEHFHSKCQLTYKPKQFNDKCQRANTPNLTMFYGSILPEEIEKGDLDFVRAIPTFETVPWIRSEVTKGVKKITYSKWIVTKDIKLVAIIQHGNFYDKSSYTRKLMSDYEKFLDKFPDLKDDTIKLMNFISGEFAKEVNSENDYMYLISAVFTKLIIDKGYDGILYPSSRVEGKGFNVALTSNAADNKLQLEAILECTAYKLNDKVILDNDRMAIIQPNQTHFELLEIDESYHSGVDECLSRLGLTTIDDLK